MDHETKYWPSNYAPILEAAIRAHAVQRQRDLAIREDIRRREARARTVLAWVLHIVVWLSVLGAASLYLSSADQLAEYRETGARR